MKHASLFSGIGGAELAATWMEWQNVFHCEINEFPRKVLGYWYPNSISYEDITTTDFTSWRGKVDILTGGFPCFVAGTPVLTKDGFTSIEDVRNGQEVLSTDGKYHTVECTMSHVADMITYMRAQGMYNSLKCTPNHPFYIRKKITKRGRNCYLPPQYVKAGDMKKGDKVGYPIHEGADKSFSIDFWKLVGTWLADGWTDCAKRKSKIPKGHRGSRVNSTNHKVYICCGKKNITRLHHIIQRAGFKYTLSEEKSVFKAIICDKWLCDFLQDFGKYAHGKHLSPQCFELDAERKSALFKGWMADGYIDKGGSFKVTTVSEKLALDMAQIARDTFKCPVSISKKTVNRACVIENRTVNERPQYCVTVSNSDRYGFYEDGFLWCNIKSVETKREINNVYNLSVKDEHSYNVWGIAVHNCQPFSMAGKRLGAEDDRYLWPHMLRAIREIQPTWVVGENVAGLVTMVQPSEEFEVGCQTSLFNESYRTREEQPYTIEEICQGLEREGYSVQPFVIPACAVGAPHRRDRIWIVAHRTDAGFEGKQGWEVNTDEPHAPADTKCSGGRKMDNEVQPKLADGERIDGNGVFRTPPNANSQRWSGGSEQTHEWEEVQAKRANIFCNAERPSSWETSSHPDSNGLQNGNASGKQHTQSRHGFKAFSRKTDWADFPTQSPICGRDDGLSLGLVNITFPKWRAESVKALGNAIVPQVIYEIFKSIENYDK